jgi:YbbR domain-containing protein
VTFPGFITRNFRLKVGCTVVALVTWVGVVYASNPPQTRVVTVPVPQQRNAIPAKFVLVHPVPDVAVRIGAARDKLNAFNPSALGVNVNWNAVTNPGVQSVPITVTSSDPNIELVDPPQSVSAELDVLDSTTLAVTPVITHLPPAGYVIASQAAAPDSVTISGPHLELSGLQAHVNIDLGNNKTNFVQVAAVLIYDSRGTRLSDLTVIPSSVTVTILVNANITSRSVAVLPSTKGTVASGHILAGITVSPPIVVLSGPQNVLNAYDSVPTSQISLSNLIGNQTFRVNLSLPPGITAAPNVVTVTVVVTTLPTPTPTPIPTPSPT